MKAYIDSVSPSGRCGSLVDILAAEKAFKINIEIFRIINKQLKLVYQGQGLKDPHHVIKLACHSVGAPHYNIIRHVNANRYGDSELE